MPENLPKSSMVMLTAQLGRENSLNARNQWTSDADPVTEKSNNCRHVRANQVSPIKDWLYLSGAKAVRQKRLRELGITCVVNCTVELPNVPLDGVESVKVLVFDTPTAGLEMHFDSIANKIEDVRHQGGKVLVHCVAGVSRSPALILAYMMKHLDMSLRQAYSHVKGIRPNVRPNAGFFSQLIDYERRLRGCTSVALIHDKDLGLTIPDVCEDELKVLQDTRWAKLILDRRNFQRVYA